jgi:hypothetical protein
MVHIRKARAGNDSYGNEWPEDAAVIDIPVEQAAVLMAIPDGGFSEAPAPKKREKQDTPAEDVGKQADDQQATEDGKPTEDPPADQKPTEIDEAPKPPRRGRPPKSKTVDE